jgi:hypothetical protein
MLTLLTAFDTGFAPVGSLTNPSKVAYADRWCHNFVCRRNGFDTSRPPSWSRIPFLLHELQKADWVWWTDADALIANPEHDVTRLLDGDLVIGCDQNGINAGSFLIRSCDWSKAFLQDCWDQTDLLGHPWFEQSAMMRLLEIQENLTHVHHVPIRSFNSYPENFEAGDFVLHFVGRGDRERLIREWLAK